MGSKRKWSAEEERALADYFHDCKERCDCPSATEAQDRLDCKGFGIIEAEKIRAKLCDLWKVDRGWDLTHVADATVRAYYDAFADDPNELLDIIEGQVSDEEAFRVFAENPEELPESLRGWFSRLQEKLSPSSAESALEPRRGPALMAQSSISQDTQTLLGAEISSNRFESAMNEAIDDRIWGSEFHVSWSTIYTNAEVNPTTANYIRKGQRLEGNYENLYRLFIEMRLPLGKATELLEAAGLTFRRGNAIDSVVRLALENGIYDKRSIVSIKDSQATKLAKSVLK